MQTTSFIEPKRKLKQQVQLKVWNFSIDYYNYSEYGLPNTKDLDFFETTCVPKIIKGKPLSEVWKNPVFMKKRQKRNTDFVLFERTGMAMSKKAIEVLLPLIKDSVEVLPLRTLEEDPFLFINVVDALDALDEDKTVFQYSSVTKTKIGVKRHVFDPEKIRDKHMFKVKDFCYRTFVSDEFKKVCQANDLNGLSFIQSNLIWEQKMIKHEK